VCNISKGADWVAGSRHDHARRVLVAAYRTYLSDWLSEEETQNLQAAEGPWNRQQQLYDLQVIWTDFAGRVKTCRPRPSVTRGVIIEDVPQEYAWLDIPSTAESGLCRGSGWMILSTPIRR